MEHKALGIEQLRADESKDKSLEGHAVVMEKAAQSKRERGKDADHADYLVAHRTAQQKIRRDCHGNGKQRKNCLPQRESEEQALLIVADLFVDLDFDKNSPPKE